MSSRQRLLNSYEEVTYDALSRVCEPNGAHVFPKVRLADVFKVQGSGVSSKHYTFALKSHFDFLVTNSEYQPLFSVEFDGPLHQTSPAQRARDSLKDDLCGHFGHALLRINSRYLKPDFRGKDLLAFFVDAWFLEEAFVAAQEGGTVPYDEPFDVMCIYSDGSDKKWPYWLTLDIELTIQRLHSEGKVGQMAPSHFVGRDIQGNYRGISWLVLDSESVIAARTAMRAQQFSAVCNGELVSMLAMFELNSVLSAVLAGDRCEVQSREVFMSQVLPKFQEKFQLASAATVSAIV